MKCCVEKCSSYSSKKQSGISFHRVPIDGNIRLKWMKAIGEPDLHPTSNSVICSNHFSPDELFYVGNKRYLIPQAIPRKEFELKKELEEIEELEKLEEHSKDIKLTNENNNAKKAADVVNTKKLEADVKKLKNTVIKKNKKIKLLQQTLRRKNELLKSVSNVDQLLNEDETK